MPLTHVILDVDGDPLAIEDARERIYKRGDRERHTPELFEAMLATRQERDYISTTSLTAKCLRQQALQRQVPYAESLDAMWAAFRGTMFHGQLEKHAVDGTLEEARFHVDLDYDGEKLHLSGSPDLVDPQRGLLYDYKFTKENPRWSDPWKDHVQQCNINRWLVDHADYMEWRGEKWYPCSDDTRYFARTSDYERVQVRPVEWQGLIVVYMDDKGVKALLCTTSIDVPKASGEGTKKARVADVWTDEVVEDFIYDRYAAAHDALTLGNVPPIPVGFEHQSHVLCNYCPVRKECAEREKGGN